MPPPGTLSTCSVPPRRAARSRMPTSYQRRRRDKSNAIIVDCQAQTPLTFRGEPIVQVSTLAWRKALERAGIADFRWHDLRHTFATWHRQAGTPTHELQRLGGWKTCRVQPRDSMR